MEEKKENEEFFYSVINDLGHYGWKLEWYKDDSHEGYCWQHNKTINIGPATENVKLLILHEIAHIDTCLGHGNKHEKEFWQQYEKLLKKYLPGVELPDYDKYHKSLYVTDGVEND